jgi:3-hydroxyacyl-[acyl-carrier-protein] dehydratase
VTSETREGAPPGGSATEAAEAAGAEADVVRIMQMIPHRYPFLMIDRVVEMYADKGAVGIKNVSIGEPFFQGHFPGEPVMPG